MDVKLYAQSLKSIKIFVTWLMEILMIRKEIICLDEFLRTKIKYLKINVRATFLFVDSCLSYGLMIYNDMIHKVWTLPKSPLN